MQIKSLSELPIKDKSVLVRVDFNVPLADGRVADDTRIRASLPTLEAMLPEARRIVLMSHLGRPKGKRVPEMSLAPAAARLSELLGQPVTHAADCVGDEVATLMEDPSSPRIVVLENLRFHPEEEANDEAFAKGLAQWGDVYVNDAFGSAHRAHASTHAAALCFPERGMGLLMEKEVKALGSLLASPEKPFIAILGGAKISGKVEVVENLLGKVGAILIGGAMAFTFLRAQGIDTGKTLVEEDRIGVAGELLRKAEGAGVSILLPMDTVISKSVKAPEDVRVASVREIGAGEMGVDIGPKTAALFQERIGKARTIFWNGPMGVFEVDDFSKGTLAVAQAVGEGTRGGATSVVGGGDSVAALHKLGLADVMTHVSTGGGASLEFVGGRELPGVKALEIG